MSVSNTKIQIGSAVLLMGTVPTDNVTETTAITTNIDQSASPSGYTAIDTALVVDDASTVAPNVWETSAGSISDPPVVDVLLVVRTGELMWCYSRTDSSETVNVIRGCGIWWQKYSASATQYNAAINDNDEIQLLGSFTMPTSLDAIVTVEDVEIAMTTESTTVMDNQQGMQESYTSATQEVTLTAQLPKNVTADAKRTIGLQALTDGNSPAKYYTEFNNRPAGSELPKKLILVVPNTVYFNKSDNTVDIGGTDYLDWKKVYFIPEGYIELNETTTFSNANQTNYPLSVKAAKNIVTSKSIQQGGFTDMSRVLETVS
jgi:hypothetical protein